MYQALLGDYQLKHDKLLLINAACAAPFVFTLMSKLVADEQAIDKFC